MPGTTTSLPHGVITSGAAAVPPMRGSVSPAASVSPLLTVVRRNVTTAPSAGGGAVDSDVRGQCTFSPPNVVGSTGDPIGGVAVGDDGGGDDINDGDCDATGW